MGKKTILAILATALVATAQPTHNQGVLDREDSVDMYLGCGLSCALDWNVRASSQLADSGSNRYGIANLEDGDFSTCWAEAGPGNGVGEYLEFQFRGESEGKTAFHGFSLKNGYTKSPELWKKNTRAKTLEVSVNGKKMSDVQLLDTGKSQWVALKDVQLGPGDVMRLTVKAVYPGSRYKDLCISEIHLSGAH